MNISSSVLKLLHANRRTDSYDIAQCAVLQYFLVKASTAVQNVLEQMYKPNSRPTQLFIRQTTSSVEATCSGSYQRAIIRPYTIS
jgi:hypothetical protein